MSTAFVQYVRDPVGPDEAVGDLFAGCSVSLENQLAVEGFMAPLKVKGRAYYDTYCHCIRVAQLGERVATFMHLEPRAMVFAGLLHDIGKVQVPESTLGKTSGWTEADSAHMRPHVMDAYRMIKGRFDFTAEVILWHHRYQADPYPRNLPPLSHDFSLGSQTMIRFYGRLLSLCDQFDAAHRVYEKHGQRVARTGEEIRELMFSLNSDMRALVNELYREGIFTLETFPEPAA